MSEIIPFRPVAQRKGKRLEDPRHLARLRTLGCVVCGRRPVEIHHVLGESNTSASRGMGRRNGDDKACALCPEHHRELHSGGQRSYEIKHGLEATADWLWKCTQEGDELDD